MHATFRLFAGLLSFALMSSLAVCQSVTVAEVLASPAKYHGAVIQLHGTFWTDGEGSLLLAAPTEEPDLEQAVAVFGRPSEDENFQRLKADRILFVKRKKEIDPEARWVVFQAAVVFEGRFEDAASLPLKENSAGEQYQILNPYRGCGSKIDLLRVVRYDGVKEPANKAVDPTP